MNYHKVARSAYRQFANSYWDNKKNQRFGQAFMNEFGYKENQGFFDTLWNTESASEADHIITDYLIDWEK